VSELKKSLSIVSASGSVKAAFGFAFFVMMFDLKICYLIN
jgi:hypothetical protein